ncbi:hypothetical protein Acsp06_10940 [Actinomycetospora sp. NBRC 106375]|uniref:hypothetical protein n=1 Tax=Actinomycetospora sp. NBRC 106375 TaxID=3032207 RepID=UPI0024A42BDC|nr:hypothetical protein [Actinomycetospora sp. NBRC 106375]GLZ44909.1 hypothetical protein Acsp06_10940 [Actinomycetospora sp. NBRC 106375]
MTAPQEAGGAGSATWLDMSRYPDTDPDTVLSPDQHELLSSSLAVDDAALPDSVWEHMLAVVAGDPADDDATDGADPDAAAGDDDPAVDDAWSEDLARAFGLSDDHDPGGHDAVDPGTDAHDDGHHDGGWV